MAKKKETPPAPPKRVPLGPCVAHDHERRTVIVFEDTGSETPLIGFIPLSYENGFEVQRLGAEEFARAYTVMADYPVERAAALYAQYARSIGASKEALDILGRFTKLTSKDIEMATSKKPAGKTAAKKTPAAKKAGASKPAAKKTAAPKGEAKAPRESAAAMFKELIMAGGKTDDQIFAAVQKKFGLDEKKRSYVAWYRNDLTKKGQKPPAAKA